YQFPKRDGMPPVKMVWYDGGNMPKRPKELEPGRKLVSNVGGQLIYGDKGTIMIDAYCKSLRVIPEKKMQELAPKLPPKTIPRSIGHYEEWIRACKGGEPAMSNFDYAGPFTEVVQLGNIALRTGKKICFDPDKFKITNDSDANKYLTHPYRKF
ncbi:MAG: gfo/Idh/MocA family oxidoreductase, partial [Planctomycetes bacterium]|nr:gfo/Idh/MocA family oxidoreductase [Planctomycetota bacterium]